MLPSMQAVVDLTQQQGRQLTRAIGHFRGIPTIEVDIIPNFIVLLHPSHPVEDFARYQIVLEGLENLLKTYVLQTGHTHIDWNSAVLYRHGVSVLEWTSLRYEMLYVAAFPHVTLDTSSRIQFFCKIWVTPLLPNVGRVVFLLPMNCRSRGCIINMDFELSDVLEAMAVMTDADEDTYEFQLSHNWLHAELLTAVELASAGTVNDDLLDEAELLLP
ncbi:uncharacterized protein EV420DRAFT_1661323 [Desarmillaria tabescens]|uniref:Uncharacterized protein n=1 Tax=Armillaria tabescens TaxID=1929756 RepID=A0AA39NQ23_ARMTA|nr:uncharacterized protein EV420DRAFT_1661323 [Desarmillaria tabescens]KAK0469762.1 hypothetical protein EV420DRAFT_1661323 [Desarmillaria tabescens]